MIIFPAVDIKDGQVVRLLQGKFDQVTQYDTDPVAIAKQWQDKGAQWVHVVDLDGALTGEMKNIDIVLKIANELNIPIQMGGGVRKKENIKQLVDGGVSRIILGTKAIDDMNFFTEVLNEFGDKIAVSLDASNGFLAQRGWTSTSDLKVTDFAKDLADKGLKTVVYTDIATDGMLCGPNFEGLNALLDATDMSVIASGGVSNLDDVKKLATLTDNGVLGTIIGKALYEGKLTLEDALNVE